MTLPFSLPYPAVPDSGFWDVPTATIDWCEENYVVSHYVAEAMNTISNLVFIILASYAIQSALKNKMETRFLLISLGFMLVGIGSWLFHMTLKYEYQLLDELPMIYATCVPFWSVFSEGKSSTTSKSIAIGVLFGAQLLTAIYLYFKDPTIHQVAYASLNIIIILKSYNLTNKHVKDPIAKKHLFRTMVLGVGIFLAGYFLWNLDVHLCSTWIDIRHFVGMPYGFFFELHGWWHILTGTGVYFYVVYLEYLRLFLINKDEDYVFVQRFGILPEVILKDTKKSS